MLTNTEEIKKVSDAPEWQNLLKKLTIHLFTLQKLKDKEAERLKAYNNTYKREAELFNELVLAWARNEKALKPGDMFYWPLHVVIPEKVEFLYEEDSQYYVKTVDGETESISKVIYEKEMFEKSSKYRELEMFMNEWPV